MKQCEKDCKGCEGCIEEIKPDTVYSRVVNTDEFTRTVKVYDAFGDLVFRYTQTIEYSEKMTDDDLAFAQKSLDNAQKEFLQSMKGTY